MSSTAASTALGAVFAAIAQRLAGASPIWLDRVHSESVQPGVDMPYVLSWFVGGGALSSHRDKAELIVATVTVARTYVQADAGAVAIAELLNNRGNQDTRSTFGMSKGWLVKTITWVRPVFVDETRSDGSHVFRHGDEYAWNLERVMWNG